MKQKGFLSQRYTLSDALSKPGVRFATQYQISFTDNGKETNQTHLELVRIKEKYKWKCEELDTLKREIENEKRQLAERAKKIQKGEKQLTELTGQIQEKLMLLHKQERQLNDKYSNYEEKYKIKEGLLETQEQALKEREKNINQFEATLQTRLKAVEEGEAVLQAKMTQWENVQERLKIKELNLDEKENYYHLQIDKMNLGLQNIISHEHSIKSIEYKLSQQIKHLRDTEQQLINQLQNCKLQEEQYDQRDLRIEHSEKLINRKLDWDIKNSTLKTDNSKSDISRFTYSIQKY